MLCHCRNTNRRLEELCTSSTLQTSPKRLQIRQNISSEFWAIPSLTETLSPSWWFAINPILIWQNPPESSKENWLVYSNHLNTEQPNTGFIWILDTWCGRYSCNPRFRLSMRSYWCSIKTVSQCSKLLICSNWKSASLILIFKILLMLMECSIPLMGNTVEMAGGWH